MGRVKKKKVGSDNLQLVAEAVPEKGILTVKSCRRSELTRGVPYSTFLLFYVLGKCKSFTWQINRVGSACDSNWALCTWVYLEFPAQAKYVIMPNTLAVERRKKKKKKKKKKEAEIK